MRARVEREKAFQLRMRGHSYNEIFAALKIPKSTLRTWFGKLVLSDAANARLHTRIKEGSYRGLLKWSQMQTHSARQRALEERSKGKARIAKLTLQHLEIIGAALYWAEGYKRLRVRDGKERMGHTISFVNSDADMIQLFIKFVRNILEIPDSKFRFVMRLYDHINEQEALEYWMKVTGFPKENFHKTTYLISGASKRKRPINRLPYGTLHVEIADTRKFHYLIGLIDGVKNQI